MCDTLILRWSGILLGILFIAAALSACGGSSAPATQVSGSSTPDEGTTKSTPDTQVQDSSRMSLDDYLTICSGPTPGQTDAELTLAGFAAVLGEFTEQLEAVEPLEEVADWHGAVLVYQRAVKEALDDAPGPGEGESEDLYILDVLFPVGLQHQPAIVEAIEGMDRELVARMVEAGCIDEDILSMSLTEEELKELGVGDGGTAGGRVITEFASISAGSDHTCGVGADGSVACWGSDFFGKASPPGGEFSFVAAGWTHTCGVRADGSVACWGDDDDGQATPPESEFVSVSAGNNHTCGIRADGSVACWGDDDDGQATPPESEFVSVSAGNNHTCGIRADGSVACWGDGYDGQATPPEGEFVSVSVYGHTCAVRTDGSVACWGDGYGGLPLAVSERPPEGDFISVSVGNTHSCGVRTDGSVACWGSDHLGQSSPPEGEFVSVSAGEYHTCGIKADASVACWGSDYDGESSPPEGEFVSVSAGEYHTCGIKADASVACWGSDYDGESSPPVAP